MSNVIRHPNITVRVEAWTISGVLTGYRVVERGPRGHVRYLHGIAFPRGCYADDVERAAIRAEIERLAVAA